MFTNEIIDVREDPKKPSNKYSKKCLPGHDDLTLPIVLLLFLSLSDVDFVSKEKPKNF